MHNIYFFDTNPRQSENMMRPVGAGEWGNEENDNEFRPGRGPLIPSQNFDSTIRFCTKKPSTSNEPSNFILMKR